MANWNYDASQYEAKSFALIPVGDYRARIEDVEEVTYVSGNSGFKITLKVNGHPGRIWYNLVLDASNVKQTNQRLGEFFDSFGIQGTVLGNGKQWIGSVGAIRIKHTEYQGKTRESVAYMIDRSRQDKLPAWSEQSVQTAAQGATVGQVEIPSELPFDV